MHFDSRSMLIALVSMHAIYGLLQLALWLQRRNDQALGLWALTNGLAVISTTLMGLRDSADYWVTVSLANAAFVGAWTVLWAGIRRFSQQPVPLWLAMGLPLLTGLVLQAVTPLHANYPARVILVSAVWVAVVLMVVFECWRAERAERLLTRRALMLSFALLAAFVTYRAVNASQLPTPDDRLLYGRLAGFTLYINLMIGMTWNLALLMMHNERLERRLHRAATRDSLTRLLNRSGFVELSQRLMRRAERDRKPMSLLLMDLDHFKQINDRHGHEAGDRVLRAFAEVAEHAIRPGDLVARHGGEEFCALLPQAGQAEAMTVAERLRAAFARTEVRLEGGAKIGATVSIGVVEIAPDETISRALSRADVALYRAKQLGRNRVEVPLEIAAA